MRRNIANYANKFSSTNFALSYYAFQSPLWFSNKVCAALHWVMFSHYFCPPNTEIVCITKRTVIAPIPILLTMAKVSQKVFSFISALL